MSREIATATAKRIAACEGKGLHAFLDWSEAKLLAQAERLHPAPDALLTGQAVAIKANIGDQDHETNCGSRILEGWRSPFEATVVKKMREHGAIVAGKTTC